MKIKTIFVTPAVMAALLFGLTLAVLLGLLISSPVYAQTATPKSAAKPAMAEAPEPYRSAFEGYQPYAEEKITNWKAANDTVERIGGWREYAKQAQQPANTPAQTIKAGEVVPNVKP